MRVLPLSTRLSQMTICVAEGTAARPRSSTPHITRHCSVFRSSLKKCGCSMRTGASKCDTITFSSVSTRQSGELLTRHQRGHRRSTTTTSMSFHPCARPIRFAKVLWLGVMAFLRQMAGWKSKRTRSGTGDSQTYSGLAMWQAFPKERRLPVSNGRSRSRLII